MNTVRTLIQQRYATLMLLLLGVGFAMLLAELWLTGHTEGIQLVAVGASVAGLLLVGMALLVNAKLRTLVALLFLVLSVSGLVGAYEHYEEGHEDEAEMRPRVANVNIAYRNQEGAEDDEHEANEHEETASEADEHEEDGEEETPPPLAPLSLAGLSVMGMVATLSKREE